MRASLARILIGSLGAKMGMAFAVVVVVAILGFALLGAHLVSRQFDDVALLRMERTVRLIRRTFEEEAALIERRVAAAAERDEMRRLLLAAQQGRPDPGAAFGLAGRLAQGLDLQVLDIVDENGQLLSSAHWPARFGYVDADDRRQVKQPGKVSLRVEGRPGGVERPTLQAVHEVRSGSVAFFLAGGAWYDEKELQRLEEIFNVQILIRMGPRVWLASTGAVELPATAQAGGQSGSSASLLAIARDSERLFEARTPDSVTTGRVSLAGPGLAARRVPLGRAGPEATTTGSVPVAESPGFGLVVVFSNSELGQMLGQLQRAFWVIAALGVPMAAGTALLLARRLTAPLASLREAAALVARGDRELALPTARRDEIGELMRAFNSMTRDLSSAEQRLKQAERVAAWREIAQRIAHEIKNPLFPIQLSIQSMQKAYTRSHPDFAEIFTESTETILEEVDRLKRIVNEFSQFARLPSPSFQPCSVDDVVQRSMGLYSGLPESIEITSRLSAPAPIAADPELLSQVFINLIANAVDAMPNGGVLTISTSALSAPQATPDAAGDGAGFAGVEVSVEDTGTGISSDALEKVFTPYFTTKAGGTGLGLAIAHRIISDHRGSIRAANRQAGGAVLTVRLPAQPDAPPAVGGVTAPSR
ncbi:MAG: HAMP domain-containing protein [Candidatus Schekmanbacteria bacterium]|nr:HAMP domain-containing protein [Candidatus Schekmanbacteria bacterium]